MTDAPQVLLEHHLKTLRLPTFMREYNKLARQCASEGVDHVRYLHRLAELELIDRERRMVERRIKAAGIVKLIECRLFSAFFHEAKLLNLRGGAIDNVPRFRSESG